MIQPLHDRVLIQRLDPKQGLLTLTDPDKSFEGIIVATGPGRLVDGERQPISVTVGQKVVFNSKWNDLASDHYDDLPVGIDPKLHLVQEADIIGILHD